MADLRAGTVGTVASWRLTVQGDADTGDDRHVFTDAFATLAAADPSRTVLADRDGGTDTLTVAAVTSAISIDLDRGGTIAGRPFTIATLGAFENAIGGDGDHRLAGNALANLLWAGAAMTCWTAGGGATTRSKGEQATTG